MSDRTETPDTDVRIADHLLEDLDGIAWEADAASMTFTHVAGGLRPLLGHDVAEWLADDAFWADRLHPEDRERQIERFVRVASSGGRFDEEYRLRRRDGAWAWVRDIGHAVTGSDGRVTAVRGLIVDVAQRKAAEASLRESGERFRRVVDHLSAIVYLEAFTDPVGGEARSSSTLYVSPQVQAILGFTPSEWIADPAMWARQVHPDDRPRLRARYERLERDGGDISAEYRMYTRTGEIRWFRDEAIVIRGSRSEPLYWQGVMIDITAERASKARADASESRYGTLVGSLPAIVYTEGVENDELQIVFMNGELEEMLGITSDEWMADPSVWARALHPDDADRVTHANRDSERTGEAFRQEYRLCGPGGQVRWFRDEAVLIRDGHGHPAHWQGVMMDITPRREAEAQRAEVEERYRTLVEQIPAVVYLDPIGQGPARYMSPQAERMFGYRAKEWYADDALWRRVVRPQDDVPSGAGSTGEPVAAAYEVRRKDGGTVWVQNVARLINDEDGRPLYRQGVLIDVTEQRRLEDLEAELVREREQAERLRAEDEMKTTFLQAVSHDLRTPLAAILGLAATLAREDLDLPEDEVRDMARRIAANSRKLDGIVADFLDLERLRRGRAIPHLQPVDVGALVRELVANSQLVAERRLALDVAPLQLWADPAMVERIVENLITNAVKHTPGDSRIWVRLERDEEGALLVVEDDGPGVPAPDRERIFEAFRQGSGAVTGSGVGLALVARFAELHDGRAWVQERPGGGASFRVRLAWRPEIDEDPADGAGEAGGAQPTGSASSAESQA